MELRDIRCRLCVHLIFKKNLIKLKNSQSYKSKMQNIEELKNFTYMSYVFIDMYENYIGPYVVYYVTFSQRK